MRSAASWRGVPVPAWGWGAGLGQVPGPGPDSVPGTRARRRAAGGTGWRPPCAPPPGAPGWQRAAAQGLTAAARAARAGLRGSPALPGAGEAAAGLRAALTPGARAPQLPAHPRPSARSPGSRPGPPSGWASRDPRRGRAGGEGAPGRQSREEAAQVGCGEPGAPGGEGSGAARGAASDLRPRAAVAAGRPWPRAPAPTCRSRNAAQRRGARQASGARCTAPRPVRGTRPQPDSLPPPRSRPGYSGGTLRPFKRFATRALEGPWPRSVREAPRQRPVLGSSSSFK